MKPSTDELHAYIMWAHAADVAVVAGSLVLGAFVVFLAVVVLRELGVVPARPARSTRQARREARRLAADPWPADVTGA